MHQEYAMLGRLIAVGLGISVATLGCAYEVVESDFESNDVRQVEQASGSALTPAQLWTMPIQVCFRNVGICEQATCNGGSWADVACNPAVANVCGVGITCSRRCEVSNTVCDGEEDCRVPAATYAVAKTTARQEMESAWQGVGGIAFQFSPGDCSGPPGMGATLEFALHNQFSGGGCNYGSSSDCYAAASVSTSLDDVRRAASHEVGHVLGAPHVHQLSNAPQLCPREEKIRKGCSDCQVAFSMGQACTSTQLGDCGVSPTNARIPTDVEKGYILGRLSDRTRDPSFRVLTSPDPFSILNYCAIDNGRPTSDFAPTFMDKVGMEIMYPASFSAKVEIPGGFKNSVSGDIIIRSDMAYTAVPALFARWGGPGEPFAGHFNVAWDSQNGGNWGQSATGSTFSGTFNVQAIRVRMTDFFQRNYSPVASAIVRSNAKHTAVVSTSVSLLTIHL